MVTEKNLANLEERIDWYVSVLANLKGTPIEFLDTRYLRGAEAILQRIEAYLLNTEKSLKYSEQLKSIPK